MTRVTIINADKYFPTRKLDEGDVHSRDEYVRDAISTHYFPDGKMLPHILGAINET